MESFELILQVAVWLPFVFALASYERQVHEREFCCSMPLCYLSYCRVPDVRGKARSDQDGIRVAGAMSSLIRNTGVKEVMLGQRDCAAYIHMHKV
eukprot:1160225-Pelagomonas_calceolata.AAC.4